MKIKMVQVYTVQLDQKEIKQFAIAYRKAKEENNEKLISLGDKFFGSVPNGFKHNLTVEECILLRETLKIWGYWL